MMRNLYNNFIRGIGINLIEWIVYYILFIIHQIALFKSVDISLFGQQGVLFALLYTTIGLSTLGLDICLAPFFSYAQQSKKAWHAIITLQILIQLVIIGIGACIALRFYSAPHTLFLNILFVASSMVEGLRKLIKIILHLSFKHFLRIGLELGTLIIYMTLVWVPYLVYKVPLSLYSLMLPFLAAAGMTCIISTFFIYSYYRTLPSITTELPHSLFYRIILMRCNTSLYSIGHQIFSGNILLPYIALHVGFATAGIWSIIQTITQMITNLMHKIGGFTSQALLSQVKGESVIVKQQAFSTITNILNQIIYAIIAVLGIAIYQGSSLHTTYQITWLLPTIMYISITIIEQWVLAYEKFYLNEERSGMLVAINAALIASSFFLIRASLSITTFLAFLLIIRIVGFIVLMILSYRIWRIKPAWGINMRYFIMAFIGIMIIYFVVHYKLVYSL
ncbi:MAG: hypothetical protein M1114_05365 [Candidatus Dependentiae bacterium]|nr:hypothetical protein [Candidatus Dependentiae bacterium]